MQQHRAMERSFAKKILFILLVVSVGTLFVHLVFQFINTSVFYGRHLFFFELTNRFDYDDESSVPTWLSQGLWLFAAVLAGLAAYLSKEKLLKIFWLILSMGALLFSIDEIASLHETILQYVHVLEFGGAGASFYQNAWFIVLPFLLGAIGIILYAAYKLLPMRTLRTMALAAFIFIFGAIAVDILTTSNLVYGFLVEGIYVGIEEFFELLGISLFIYALADYLEQVHGDKIQRAFSSLKK